MDLSLSNQAKYKLMKRKNKLLKVNVLRNILFLILDNLNKT